jgi:hypothetical protein
METKNISLRLLQAFALINVTIAESGTNAHNRYVPVVFQLGIPIAAIVWQRYVARANA